MALLGARLALALEGGCIITLGGPLGAGKTTLVRALLRTLGYTGTVRSPTYTLVESYAVEGRKIHHFDFYRLTDPAELEYIGLRDLLEPGVICLIEWPERGAGQTPRADLHIEISLAGSIREVELRAPGPSGQGLIAGITCP